MRLVFALLCCGLAYGETPKNDLYEALLEVLREPATETAGEAFPAEAIAFFEREVRPILAERCYECHGPETQRNSLRLDTRAGHLRGGELGPAIVPGNPEGSRLIEALRRTGELKMPPDDALPDEEVQRLIAWVEMGAPWPAETAPHDGLPLTMAERVEQARAEHWAFQPVVKPLPPGTDGGTDIDGFVRARLRGEGLDFAAVADRRTLIRRLSFDLIGLPPTFDEVETFVADDSPDAYEKVVDRLLASPRFGERWGRYWLDVARYSDTKGYVFNEDRNYAFSHTYRDYVIRAYNEDLPYNEFVMHQIAADQMEMGDDKRPLAAMGFLNLGRRFINNIHDITDDRIDVVTRGMLGLTVTCARCHDHKYDPIPAADYYSLYGVFRSSHEPGELPLIEEPDPNDEQYQDFQRKLESAQTDLESYMHSEYVGVSKHARERIGDYLLAAYDARDMAEQGEVQALAKERELHWQLVQRWRDRMKAEDAVADPIFGAWAQYGALAAEGFAEASKTVTTALTKDDAPVNPLLRNALKEKEPGSMGDVSAVYGELFQKADDEWLQRIAAAFQMAALTEGATPELPETLPDANLEAFRSKLYSNATPANVPKGELEQFLDIPARNRITNLRVAIQRVENTHPGRPDRAMILADNGTPFDPYVFKRGKPGIKGDAVPRQFVEILSEGDRKPFEHGSGRLELAKAIASEDNPLTARVYVNRVWSNLLGRPLVDSPSDFGVRSDAPTHPELLDYLAATFMEDGWSTKQLIRRIVLSDTYRQSSDAAQELRLRDPENRLLARQNRKRLDFEALRDSWLAAAGILSDEMFGPSVDITRASAPPRRTVYARIERQNLPALFRTFDFASPDTHSPARYFTTVPQQALFALNSPFVVEQARKVVDREPVAAKEEQRDRIVALYRVAYQREPSDREIEAGLAFIERQGEPEAPEREAPAWSYGYGQVDSESGAVSAFTLLPHYSDRTWKGGEKLPDETLGWVSLNATGGHPGSVYAAIRRWTAPYDALVNATGELRHSSDQGDGVHGFIVHNENAKLWDAIAKNDGQDAKAEFIEVAAGDTIDFVVAAGANESFDSFRWVPLLSMVELRGENTGGQAVQWHAREEFSGTPETLPEPLTAWEEYAQVLLLANEFVFVD